MHYHHAVSFAWPLSQLGQPAGTETVRFSRLCETYVGRHCNKKRRFPATICTFRTQRPYRHICRIVWIILCLPIFAIFNWFCAFSYQAAGFLVPIPQIYEAFAIVALFYLYVTYTSPDETNRERFFDGLERRTRWGRAKHGKGSLGWFHVSQHHSASMASDMRR